MTFYFKDSLYPTSRSYTKRQCVKVRIYRFMTYRLSIIRVNGENTKLKHKWQLGISASRAKCKHPRCFIQFKKNSRGSDEEKVGNSQGARTKVSVEKDDVQEENRYWQQECHVTKNSIRHKTVNFNFNTLPLCITS